MLEAVRIPVARWLLLRRPFIHWGLNLIPNSHPFKSFAASTYDDLDEFTHAALKTRNQNGTPRVKVPCHKHTHRRAMATLAIAYLLVAQLVTALPAIVVYHGPGKVYPLHALGITEEPVKAPRLRVFITPNEHP